MPSRLAVQAGVGLMLALWAARSEAVTATWLGGTGNWSDPTLWDSDPFYPCNGNGGQSYDAILTSGTVTLDLTCSVETFTFSGGSVAGGFDLTVNQLFSWSLGSLAGSGLVTAISGASLSGTATKSFTGARSLTIAGASTWSAGGISLGSGGATLRNQGTLSVSGAGGRTLVDGASSGTFLNEGSLTVALAAAANLLTITPTNLGQSGAVHVNTGILAWDGSGSYTGSFDGSGTLRFSGGTQTLASGSSVTTADTEVTGGSLTVQPGATFDVANLDISSVGTLSIDSGVTANAGTASLTSGTLTGAGTLEIAGLLGFSLGTMSGSGETHALAGVALSGSGTKTLTGTRTLRIGGSSSTWSAGGIFLGTGGATLRNLAGSTLLVTGANRSLYDSGGGNVVNEGTLTIALDTAATLLAVSPTTFSNSGAVHVNLGTVSLNTNGAYSGSFDGAGTLRFNVGSHDLASGSSVTTSAVEVTGGTTTVQPGASFSVGSLLVQTGTLVANAPLQATTLNVISGSLSGSGDVQVTGPLTWSGGAMEGSGITHAQSGATLATSGSKVFAGTRSLELEGGSSSWSGGMLNLGVEGASLHNEAGSTFVITGPTRSLTGSLSASSVSNEGTLALDLDAQANWLSVSTQSFTQSGFLDLLWGTFLVAGTTTNFTQSAGVTRLEGGALRSISTPLHFQGGVLDGAGSIQADVESSAVISPGLSAGTLSIDGDLTLLPGGELRSELGGAAQGSEYDFVSVSGSAALAGVLTVAFVSDFHNAVTPAQTFTLVDAGTPLAGAFSNVASGQRVLTPPEWDSIAVSYGAGSPFDGDLVVLHDFRAFVPRVTLSVSGSAQGGTIVLVVAGIPVVVTTEAGWTAEQVAEAIAAAIRSTLALSSKGRAGVATGTVVGINAPIGGDAIVMDPGIDIDTVVDVPALPAIGAALLALALAAAGARALRARR